MAKKMTKNQRKAAMDAIAGLLGQPPIDEPTGPQNGPQVPQAFADAWNKIIETYDNENVSIADLQELLEKIQTGKITILEAVGKVDLANPHAKQGAEAALQILIKSKYGPIVVTSGGSGGSGPQLKAPKNIEVRDKQGNPISQDKPDSQDGEQGGDKGPQTKVTKTGDKSTDKPEDKPDSQDGGAGGKGEKGEDKPNSQDGGSSGGDSGEGSKSSGKDSGGTDGGSKKNRSEGDSKDKASGSKTSSDEENDDPHGFNDEEKNAKTMQGIKADQEYKKEQEEQDKQDAWNKMLANTRSADFSELESDLYYAIAAQVGESREMDDTWEHGEDPVYDDSDFMRPQQDFEEQRTKPLIYVFFDQSGSFGQGLINKGKSVLKVLDDFVADGKIMPPKLFVFGDQVHEYDGSQVSGLGGGTRGWPRCMQKIKESLDLPLDERCTNVMVLSDSDIQGQTSWGRNYTPDYHGYGGWKEKIEVEGCVFWCWANNDRGPTCEEHLVGAKGNFRYTF